MTSLSFVFCPSVWPFDHGSVRAARTAAQSCSMPEANEAIKPVLASESQSSKRLSLRCWIMR